MQYPITYIDQLRFLEASRTGDMATVKKFLRNGGDLNASNSTGTTALIYAAAHSQIEVVQYLLSNGADCTVKNENGFNAIAMARKHKNIEVLEVLQTSPYVEDTVQEEIRNINEHQAVIDKVRKMIEDEMDVIHSNFDLFEFGGGNTYTNSILASRADMMKRKLYTIYQQPIFGQIEYVSYKGIESFYIGRYDFEDLILSNKNKVAQLFYQKKIGQYLHDTLGLVDVLSIKQFVVQDGIILSVYEITDKKTAPYIDPILEQRLEETASTVLKDVVETIQTEQYQVISSDSHTPLIVQGSAGSGKSTIALHRLEYLLYNHKNMNPSRMVIFAPNNLFIQYIKNTLPDIGISEIHQTTFYEWWKENMVDEEKHSYTYQTHNDFISIWMSAQSDERKRQAQKRNKMKGSLDFKDIITEYFNDIEQDFNPVHYCDCLVKINEEIKNRLEYVEKENGISITSKQVYPEITDRLNRMYKDYSYLPLSGRRDRIFRVLLNDIKTFLRNLKVLLEDRVSLQDQVKVIDQLVTKGIQQFKRNWRELSSFDLYYRLVSEAHVLQKYWKDEDLTNFTKANRVLYENKMMEASDLAGILMMDDFLNRGLRIANKKLYDYIIIDEGQDYNPLEIYLLSEFVQTGKMTILGDLGQSIYDYRSIDTWGEFAESIQESMKIELAFIELSNTYRSTNQITNYSNEIIKDWSRNRFTLAQAFGRDGQVPLVKKGLSFEQKREEIQNQLRRLNDKGYENIAILTRNQEAGKILKQQLSQTKQIHYFNSDSESYEGGTVILPVVLSKGLEFDAVIILDAEQYKIETDPFEQKLLYVACTRALHELIIL